MKSSRDTVQGLEWRECSNGCGKYSTNLDRCPVCYLPKTPENMQKLAIAGANGTYGVSLPAPGTKTPGNGRKTSVLNKTEMRLFHNLALLELMGIVLPSRYVWIGQGFSMRFPDGDEYRPDYAGIFPGCFAVRDQLPPLGSVIVEIKGGYRGPGWEQGYERFKRARIQWPQYEWHCWEWKKGKWTEILKVM